MIKTYINGIKFGLILQFAIGPMCLLVFNTSQNTGLLVGLYLVLAIALVDAFYITLASIGASQLLENKKIKATVKILGSTIIIALGINIILNVFGINFIPALNLTTSSTNIFIKGLILALSNPITIVFWGSVLTTKIIEDNLKKKELFIFSCGLVSATILFLSSVAILGTILSSFIPKAISNIINIIVGLYIIFFGIRLLTEKNKKVGVNKNELWNNKSKTKWKRKTI